MTVQPIRRVQDLPGTARRVVLDGLRAGRDGVREAAAGEGCRRPFAWCDIHHRRPWSRGAPTDLANAVPLCGWHHRRAHDSRFDLAYLPTGEVRYHRRR